MSVRARQEIKDRLAVRQQGDCSTVQSKSSDPLSKLLQQNTGHCKDTPISSIFDLWQLTLSYWLSLDAFTTIESEICEKCEQIMMMMSFTVCWEPGVTHKTCFSNS